MQKITRTMLERAGHEVLPVSDGQAAFLQTERQSFDVLLLDIQMPEMDGIETALAIRQREQATGERLPIVALTANPSEMDQARCLAAGMDGCLSKPVRWEQLSAALSAAVQ